MRCWMGCVGKNLRYLLSTVREGEPKECLSSLHQISERNACVDWSVRNLGRVSSLRASGTAVLFVSARAKWRKIYIFYLAACNRRIASGTEAQIAPTFRHPTASVVFPAPHFDFREKPVRQRLYCRLEPSVRGRGEAVVCVHAGAAAGVARNVQRVPERPDLASACR